MRKLTKGRKNNISENIQSKKNSETENNGDHNYHKKN